jgi:hypothetical protein
MDVMFNIIGLSGMCCFLLAYLFLQKGRMKPDGYNYLFMNLAGAVLILISLLWDWNLSAFMLEVAWFLITGYGIWRRWRKDKAAAA